jgi:hypothetical protein
MTDWLNRVLPIDLLGERGAKETLTCAGIQSLVAAVCCRPS